MRRCLKRSIQVTFAKPWERPKSDPVIEKAKAQAANAPWEPPLPDVDPEILDAYEEQAKRQHRTVRMDEAFALVFARAYCLTQSPLEVMFGLDLADPEEDTSRIIKRYHRYMAHPMVKAAIHNVVTHFTETDILSRDRVMYGLFQEAADRGPFTTSSSRVAAWGKLASLMGMDPTEQARMRKEEQDLIAQKRMGASSRSGVMLLPAPVDIESWEAGAMGQQAQLKADVRT